MDFVLLTARLVLCAVFLVAGIAKLADLKGSQQAMRDFGAPAQLATPLGTLLPLAELVVAGALLFPFFAWWAGLGALRALGKPVLLLFSDPGCGPCHALLPEIGRWQQEHATKVVVALISRGTVEANRPKGTEHGLRHVLLQQDREVAQAYQASGTPSAVLVRRDGTVGSPLAQGADAIRALLDQALSPAGLASLPMAATQRNGNGRAAAAQPPTSPKIGEPAPDFSLPDLSGQMVNLSDFRGDKTLVLFWRPSCGFCQRMLDDLKAWETNPPADAPKLLVVSTDSVESNQAMKLRSPVLLDQAGMRVGSLFGATGTPMAVLVDAQGKIASELAVGAPAVLTLLDRRQDTTIST